MILGIINKILLTLFFLSCLTTIRHSYFFIQAILVSTEEQPVKYKLSVVTLSILGIAIAYILTVLFTGISLK